MRRVIKALLILSSLFFLFTLLSNYPLPLPFPFSALFPPPNAGAHKLIFLLAGQSNMAGRGALLSDSDDRYGADTSVLRLNRWLYWETAREPLHYDIDVNKTCGVGPGLVFAKTLLRKERYYSDDLVIGIVPCAVGGTKIDKWSRESSLYKSMVNRAKASVEKKRGGGKIEALLWFQGETDTISLEDAETYGDKMETLVRNMRADLDLPNLPVIQVALASGEGNYTSIVREKQKGISLRNVRTVDAYGLPLNEDQLHLSTQAQIKLGKMLAQSYLSLLTELNSTPQP